MVLDTNIQTNTLHNLINEQDNVGKIYLYTKGLNELKYEILIEKRKNGAIVVCRSIINLF